jgi:hypothetical protein
MFIKPGICLLALTHLISFRSLALLPDSLTGSSSWIRPPRQFLQLGSPAEKSIIRYRPDPAENKGYVAVVIERGQGSWHTLPASMSAGFDYTTSLSSQAIHYNGHLSLPLISSSVSFTTLGLEYGHRNGSVFGLNAIAYGSKQLSGSLTSSVAVELRYGYNFPLSKRFWLRPTAAVDFIFLSARFDEGIDNHDQDLYIFDKTFPYSAARGSRQITSAATNVAFNEDLTLGKLRFDLLYELTRGIFITAGAGYSWTLSHKEYINISNKATFLDLPFNAAGLDFKTTVQPDQVFSLNGLSYCFGINLRLGKK